MQEHVHAYIHQNVRTKLAANRIYTSTVNSHISINNLQQNILISLIRSPFEHKVNRMNW